MNGEEIIGSAAHRVGRGWAGAAPMSRGFLAGIVGLCDASGIFLCGLVVHALYVGNVEIGLPTETAPLALYVLLAVLMMHAAGLYRFTAIVAPRSVSARIIAIQIGVFLLMTSVAFALKISADYSRVWAFSWLSGSIVLVLGLRWILSTALRALARSGRLGRRILIYGANDQARRLIGRIESLDEPWNHIVGVFDDRRSRAGPRLGRYPVMGNLGDLVAWGRSNTPDEVLVALPWGAEERLLSVLRSLAVLPVNVRLCPEFFSEEIIQGRTSYQFGLPMLSAHEKPFSGWEAIGKRAFDVVLSSLVAMFAMPLLLLIAALIKLESPGPVLFRQKRYGFNNNVIEVYKFRSMRVEESDALGDRLTERNDPRVTRVGAVLRRTSLDELPQVINVLLGEMSIIGPRPHALHTTAGGRQCEEVVDRYSVRHKVKPGITGWAQVSGYRGTMQDEEHLRKRIEHDLYYIKHWTPWFDLKILLLTFWIVVYGRNSY